MPSSRLGCPLSLKTPNMGNPGFIRFGAVVDVRHLHGKPVGMGELKSDLEIRNERVAH